MADQLRHDCLGYVGEYPVLTPNLDELARIGVRFTHAFSAIPTCCPARQAFLRTKRPESFGAYWNYDITFPIAALSPDEYTWTRQLQKVGYRNAYIGKWHVNPDHDPREYGYESYFGVEDYSRHFEKVATTTQYVNAWRGEPDLVQLEDSRTHVLAHEASQAIRRLAGTNHPWHVRLDFPEPHLPCRPAGQFAEMYDAKDMRPWGSFSDTLEGKPFIQRQQLRNWAVEDYTWDDWAPIVARYFGAISQVDDAVGRVIDTLKETGQFENTIIVFTADHGDLCGAHRMVDKHYVMYDDVVRVPLVVSWPSRITTGTTIDSFVSATLDTGPTLLDLLDLDLPADTHGSSLRGLLEGSAPHRETNEIIATYNGAQFGLYCQRMLRTDRWKYIWNLADIDEMYDLRDDPCELTNRIDDPNVSEIGKRMRRRLFELLAEANDPLSSGPWLVGQLTEANPVSNLEIPQTV